MKLEFQIYGRMTDTAGVGIGGNLFQHFTLQEMGLALYPGAMQWGSTVFK